MAFVIAEDNIRTAWFPVDGTSSVSLGAIVTWYQNGVIAIGAATGASNTTNKYVPLGIVVGGNTWDDDSTATSVTGVNTAAAQLARNWRGAEGAMYTKGDPAPLVKVALIDACSVIKGPIYNSTSGTAPTVSTAASGLSTTGFTCSATCGFTPVANNATHQWRSGTNAGVGPRIGTDTSTTVHTVAKAFPYTPVAGDTVVSVNVRPGNSCKAQLDATAMFIDTSAALTSDYYLLDVIELDLRIAGAETALFRFNADNFTAARA